jgi:hypothetical protein
MEDKKIMKQIQSTLLTSLVTSLLLITSAHALAKNGSTSSTKFVTNPTSLAAKSFALKKFGRNISVLSNRFLKSSGCYRIVIKTKSGNRETLKICGK